MKLNTNRLGMIYVPLGKKNDIEVDVTLESINNNVMDTGKQKGRMVEPSLIGTSGGK